MWARTIVQPTSPPTCATCAHCDTSERRSLNGVVMAGVCTKAGWHFNGGFVFAWMAGCPVHEPREVTP